MKRSAQKFGEGDSLYCFLINKVFTHKNLLFLPSIFARVAELVDALDSKSSDFGRAGSIPASSTAKNHNVI